MLGSGRGGWCEGQPIKMRFAPGGRTIGSCLEGIRRFDAECEILDFC